MIASSLSRPSTNAVTFSAKGASARQRACRPVSCRPKKTSGQPLLSVRRLDALHAITPTVLPSGTAPRKTPVGRQAKLSVSARGHIGNVTSTNPALQFGKFEEAQMETSPAFGGGELMSVEGAVDKTAILLAMTTAAAAYTWSQIYAGVLTKATVFSLSQGAGIAGMVLALITCFKPHWSPKTVPLYALCEGVALGGMSAILDLRFPGIVIQTLCLTFGTLFALLASYRSGLITVNEGFRTTVYTATGGFAIGMMGLFLMRMMGVSVPFLMSGPIAIGIGVVSVALAASNLLLDFDAIQSYDMAGMPKWMEWYSGFTLLVTLVWMYTSILRVLALLRGSDQ